MQWGQIKTLFILCFLVLNVFLVQQLVVKLNEPDLINKSTIEDKLKAESITYENLPTETDKESYISAKRKQFTEKEMKDIKQFDNQEIQLVNEDTIVSEFDEPISLDSASSEDEVEQTIKNNVNFSDQYVFWQWNKELNTLVFFQRHNDQPIYYNQGGLLLVTLNEDNEMVRYAQTLMEDVEPQDEESELIKPLEAIETLYNENELQYEDEISQMKLGYHALANFTNGVQVVAPTWRITVNEEHNYFVNAIEGHFFSSDDTNFIEEARADLFTEPLNSESETTPEQTPETEDTKPEVETES